ncbi:hypothetical protein BJV78DRAFT_1151939 [Lactifluus subvellereus]|nr:hypothetical protein BJV78DRAFT_1151939 [Lactifluus subvellereus]
MPINGGVDRSWLRCPARRLRQLTSACLGMPSVTGQVAGGTTMQPCTAVWRASVSLTQPFPIPDETGSYTQLTHGRAGVNLLDRLVLERSPDRCKADGTKTSMFLFCIGSVLNRMPLFPPIRHGV